MILKLVAFDCPDAKRNTPGDSRSDHRLGSRAHPVIAPACSKARGQSSKARSGQMGPATACFELLKDVLTLR